MIRKIKLVGKNKRGDSGLTMPKLLAIVLGVVLLVLIYYGITHNFFGPFTNKLAGFFNYAKTFIGLGVDEPEAPENIIGNILGKDREIVLNDGSGKCFASIDELGGKFALDFNSEGSLAWSRKIGDSDFWQEMNPGFIKRTWAGTGKNTMIYDYYKDSQPKWVYSYDGISQSELDKKIRALSIDVDGKDYPIELVNEGISIKFGEESFLFSTNPYTNDPEDIEIARLGGRKEVNQIIVNYYDFKTNKIITPFNQDSEKLKKLQEAFSKFLNTKKISIGEEEYGLFLERAFVNGNYFQVFGIRQEYFQTGVRCQSVGSNDNRLLMRFTISEDKLSQLLNQIKSDLEENCNR